MVTVGMGAVQGLSEKRSFLKRVLKGCENLPDMFSREETPGIWDLKSRDSQKRDSAKKKVVPGSVRGERRRAQLGWKL